MREAQEALVDGDIQIDALASPRGRFTGIFPLFDGTGRLLVAWSQCRVEDPLSDPLAEEPDIIPCTDELLADPLVVEADPLYGIWVLDPSEATQQPILVPDEGEAYTEAVVLEPRTLPAVILDRAAGIELDADLVSEGVGVVHIRSLYDFDGVAIGDINALSDPAVTTAADRPFQFVRVVKAVSIPDEDIVDLDNTAFGISQQQLMREIIGTGRVEPDGSVKMRVPANIPFYISVLDANGRRVLPRHQNWLQLRPGEEMECHGCHTSTSQLPHGRLGAQPDSVNPGAPTDGQPFPNTESALFANAGETMAEVYTRINGIPEPNVDIDYDDVWTDPNVRAKDASFSYSYQDLTSTPPIPGNCVTDWNASCRIVVNYEMHIHPLWGVPRITLDTDGVTVLADDTCNTCHAPADAMGVAQVPAGQLDLADGASADEADHFKSYRELFVNDNRQVVDNGALIDELVPLLDANGDPVFETDVDGNLILDANGDPIPVLVTINVGPTMNVAGALASPGFFDRFAPGGTHAGRLTPAELKLISEWNDIGAQYYNNPFDVPP